MNYWVIIRRSIACLVACYASVSILGNVLSTAAMLVFPNMSETGVSVTIFLILSLCIFIPAYILAYFFLKRDNIIIPPMRHAFIRMLCCYFTNLLVLVLVSFLIGLAKLNINGYVLSAISYLACFFICVYILYQCCKKDWEKENAGVQ